MTDSTIVSFIGNIEIVDINAVTLDLTLEDGTITFIPTSVDDNGNSLPSQFALRQNYPNPFNPTTNISYSVEKAGDYLFEVYNISGQLVERMDLGYKTVGEYEINFSGEQLSSGIYTYRLLGNNQSQSRQMILTK